MSQYVIGGIAITKAGWDLYVKIKQRNTGEVVDKNACGKIVYTFAIEGHLDGPGTHAGACGVKKDHSRVYCCPSCFQKNWK